MRPRAPALSAPVLSALALLMLAACHAAAPEGAAVPGDRGDQHPFAGIAPGETVQFTGTEPFWGGAVTATQMTFRTPEKPNGQAVAVSRFAGRGGLSFSGTLDGAAFTLAITPGACSDGMSDRAYPLVATFQRGGETLNGCAWSAAHPFTGPAAP
ncbi:MAG: hypothetical protein ABS87_09275 [Sphingomonas sp. SCN 67-18]|uniref:COG3650 family protein n=1 Tax=uncultured Sphingomonas sp. TaxID=158754 RepID=UPI00086B1525|nr:hypothetical protein [Sphingomonas sp. SCN 67-18]ODU20709.1 MAG: hypothetical protein ABS87_09275 [Sphingomonas sp. SCN 67-18]